MMSTLLFFTQVLIEKEWLSFGHKFSQRIGHGSDKHNDDQRSPIFLQFIECVWQVLSSKNHDKSLKGYLQIMQQFPDVFEFNENLLCVVLDHLYSCLFGTFLCNSHKEREDMKLAQETQSLWSFINSKQRSQFLNQMYCKPINSKVAIFPITSIRFGFSRFSPNILCCSIEMVCSCSSHQVYAVLERLPLQVEPKTTIPRLRPCKVCIFALSVFGICFLNNNLFRI